MDSLGEQRELAGIRCPACGGPYKLIRILGRYGQSYKLLVRCPTCNVYGIGTAQAKGRPDRPASPIPLCSPATASKGPVSEADVAAMREFLRTFDGDFRALWARKGGS